MVEESWDQLDIDITVSQVLDEISRALKWHPPTTQKHIKDKLLDALEWERKNHNFLFPCVKGFDNHKQAVSWRWVFAVEDISKWQIIAKLGWSVTPLSEWLHMDEEVGMWHMMVGGWFTLWARTIRDCDEWDYINHSCDPNSGVQGHIDLVAMEDISSGSEICFDYWTVVGWIDISMIWDDPIYKAMCNDDGNAVIIDECTCWSELCRGSVLSNDWERLMMKSKYSWFFSHHVQWLINNL